MSFSVSTIKHPTLPADRQKEAEEDPSYTPSRLSPPLRSAGAKYGRTPTTHTGLALLHPPSPYFLCPLSHSVMVDPVVAQDGRSYERAAIEAWFAALAASGQAIASPPIPPLRPPTLDDSAALHTAEDRHPAHRSCFLPTTVLSSATVFPNTVLRLQILDWRRAQAAEAVAAYRQQHTHHQEMEAGNKATATTGRGAGGDKEDGEVRVGQSVSSAAGGGVDPTLCRLRSQSSETTMVATTPTTKPTQRTKSIDDKFSSGTATQSTTTPLMTSLTGRGGGHAPLPVPAAPFIIENVPGVVIASKKNASASRGKNQQRNRPSAAAPAPSKSAAKPPTAATFAVHVVLPTGETLAFEVCTKALFSDFHKRLLSYLVERRGRREMEDQEEGSKKAHCVYSLFLDGSPLNYCLFSCDRTPLFENLRDYRAPTTASGYTTTSSTSPSSSERPCPERPLPLRPDPEPIAISDTSSDDNDAVVTVGVDEHEKNKNERNDVRGGGVEECERRAVAADVTFYLPSYVRVVSWNDTAEMVPCVPSQTTVRQFRELLRNKVNLTDQCILTYNRVLLKEDNATSSVPMMRAYGFPHPTADGLYPHLRSRQQVNTDKEEDDNAYKDDFPMVRLEPDMIIRALDVDGLGAFEVPFRSVTATVSELRILLVTKGNHGKDVAHRYRLHYLRSGGGGLTFPASLQTLAKASTYLKDIPGVLPFTPPHLTKQRPDETSSRLSIATHSAARSGHGSAAATVKIQQCPLLLQLCVRSNEDAFRMIVKTLAGKSVEVIGHATDEVEELKVAIWEKEGIPMDLQRIIFGGKQLELGRTLADYLIKADSTVHLVLRMRGG